MRSLIFASLIVAIALISVIAVVNDESFLNHTTVTQSSIHKGDEGWPIIPVAGIAIATVIGGILARRKNRKSSTDRVVYNPDAVVPNERPGSMLYDGGTPNYRLPHRTR